MVKRAEKPSIVALVAVGLFFIFYFFSLRYESKGSDLFSAQTISLM